MKFDERSVILRDMASLVCRLYSGGFDKVPSYSFDGPNYSFSIRVEEVKDEHDIVWKNPVISYQMWWREAHSGKKMDVKEMPCPEDVINNVREFLVLKYFQECRAKQELGWLQDIGIQKR
jgi:hypothetical protein